MARIICEAIIEDEATMKEVLTELSDAGAKPQVFRDYVYVDFQSDKSTQVREVKGIFHSLRNYRIKQTD